MYLRIHFSIIDELWSVRKTCIWAFYYILHGFTGDTLLTTSYPLKYNLQICVMFTMAGKHYVCLIFNFVDCSCYFVANVQWVGQKKREVVLYGLRVHRHFPIAWQVIQTSPRDSVRKCYFLITKFLPRLN